MNDFIDEFCTYASAELGLSPATLAAYRNDLNRFQGFSDDVGISLIDMDVNAVASYLQLLTQQGYASSSIVRYMMAVQLLYEFFLSRGLVKSNPVKALDMPEQEQLLPDIVSREKMVAILAAVDMKDRLALRDRAILEVFYASGVRVSELITLRVQDFYPKLGMLKVSGKGSKDRVAPIHQEAMDALQNYLDVLRPRLEAVPSIREKTPTDACFLSRAGRPLTRMAVWTIVHDAGKAAGLPHLHPHALRHTMASHLLSGGADLRVIQEILGHEDVSTTQRYTHVDLEHLKRIHKLHPRQ